MLKKSEIENPILVQDLGMEYPTETSKLKSHYGTYKCYCGNTFKARMPDIKNGKIRSCGCHNKQRTKESRTKHGLRSHPLYHVWNDIIKRTTNPNNKSYRHYGGRGITICERWLNIANFIDDMYPTYKKGLSIDRINNNGNYELSNCRWTTNVTQLQNTRKIRCTNTSGYRGVSFNKRSKKWVANISVDNKLTYLGYYCTALEAAKAYDTFVIDNKLQHTTNGVLEGK